jgi:hypothetical protein
LIRDGLVERGDGVLAETRERHAHESGVQIIVDVVAGQGDAGDELGRGRAPFVVDLPCDVDRVARRHEGTSGKTAREDDRVQLFDRQVGQRSSRARASERVVDLQ